MLQNFNISIILIKVVQLQTYIAKRVSTWSDFILSVLKSIQGTLFSRLCWWRLCCVSRNNNPLLSSLLMTNYQVCGKSNTTVTNTKGTKKEKHMIYNTTQKTGWIYVLRNGKHRTKIFRSMSSLDICHCLLLPSTFLICDFVFNHKYNNCYCVFWLDEI
jgi:hypothetical protein